MAETQDRDNAASPVLEYVRAVLSHTIVLLAGVLGVALTIVSLAIPGLTRVVGVALTSVSLAVAQYQAWNDMRIAREEAQSLLRRMEGELSGRSLRFAGLVIHNLIGDPPTNSSVQVGISLQNFGDHVIRYDVEHFEVVLDGNTIEDPSFLNRGGEIAPRADESYFFPAIRAIDVTRASVDGNLAYSVVYGHPDHRPTRRMTRRMRFTLFRSVGSRFVDNPRWTPTVERDEALSGIDWSSQ
jgi:hypothetical protein